MVTEDLSEQQVKQHNLEEDVRGFNADFDATSNRASLGSDSKGNNKMIT